MTDQGSVTGQNVSKDTTSFFDNPSSTSQLIQATQLAKEALSVPSEDQSCAIESPLSDDKKDLTSSGDALMCTTQDEVQAASRSEQSFPIPGIIPPNSTEPSLMIASGDGGNNDGGMLPPTDSNTSDNGGKEHPMSLLEHLGELRRRLIRCFIIIGVSFFICYGVADVLFRYLSLPLVKVMPADTKLIFTGVPEGFFVYLKVAFVAALFIASPYIFYQIWAFISPGLYDEEKRYIWPLALSSAFFFLGGSSFCYFVVFPFAFTFFMSYSTDTILAMPSLNEYLSFSLKLLIAFGLIFEMPLFAFFLAKMRLITAEKMRAVRKYAILAVFIIAAILTPPDVFSQILMAIPMLILYEISIFVAASVAKQQKEKVIINS